MMDSNDVNGMTRVRRFGDDPVEKYVDRRHGKVDECGVRPGWVAVPLKITIISRACSANRASISTAGRPAMTAKVSIRYRCTSLSMRRVICPISGRRLAAASISVQSEPSQDWLCSRISRRIEERNVARGSVEDRISPNMCATSCRSCSTMAAMIASLEAK